MHYIYTSDNAAEAHMISHMLEQHGIMAQVHGEFLQSGAGEIAVPNCIKVSVVEDDAKRAKELLQQWEAKNSPELKKVKSELRQHNTGRNIAIAFLAGALLSWTYFQAPVYPNGADYNNDGILDTFYTYSAHGILQGIKADLNFDGEIDMIQSTDKNGIVDTSETDADFDGFYETKSTFENGNLSMTTVDYNKDKLPDRTYFYDKNGHLRTVHYHHEETGKTIKISNYENDKLLSSKIDSDYDGEMDLIHTYDIYENMISETEIETP